MTYGIHREELALQASKGEGRGGRETKGEGSWKREGRTKGHVPFLTRFALFYLISHSGGVRHEIRPIRMRQL